MYDFHSLSRKFKKTESKFISDMHGYVVFVPNSKQSSIVKYVEDNFIEIQKKFKKVHKCFAISTDLTFENEIPKALKYRYPILHSFEPSKPEVHNFKDYLGWSNYNFGCFIIIDKVTELILFDYETLNDFKNFIQDYTNSIKIEEYDYLPVSSNNTTDFNIKLDDETEEKLNIILTNLSDLKNSGKLLTVMPLIKKFLKDDTPINKLSDLIIYDTTDKFELFLTDYELEIKLSHLTKSIYILFSSYPEGILLTELKLYRSQLLEIYKEVSNRDDYDKMSASIDDIVDLSTNAIYVHLSRIKSAFTKLLHPNIAKHYYIYGDKSEPKKIDIKDFLLIRQSILNDMIDIFE